MHNFPWEMLASISIVIDFAYNHRNHVKKAYLFLVVLFGNIIVNSPVSQEIEEEI